MVSLFLAIAPDQLSPRHPYLLWIRSICSPLKESFQSLFIVKYQQSCHEKAVQPGVKGPGALAQCQADAAGSTTQQCHSIECTWICGKIRSLRPGGQGL